MEYLSYIYDTIEDMYYYLFGNRYDDKEIKELENRYIELCKFVNENKNIDDDNNNNNNKSNNDGALKLKVPSI